MDFIIIAIWIITAFTIFIGLFWVLIAIKYKQELRKYPEAKVFPSLSVMIPAHNEGKTIEKCIKSILNLKYAKKIQIIVVNDGSTDNTKEIAERFANKGKITLINQTNKGKGAALNHGLKYATGEIAAVMDADSLVTKDILKTIAGHFEDKKVGAVVSSITPIKSKTLLQHLQDGEYIISCLFRRLLSLTNMNYITPGVFSVFRTSSLKKVGGFDEDNLTEDMEIALRLQKNGYEVRNSMLATTKTALPETAKGFYRQRIRWYRGLIQNTVKYKDMLFNKKYGYLGTFQLPINMMFPFIAVLVMSFLFYVTGLAIYQFAQYLYIVGFKTSLQFSLERALLGFDWMIYIPWIIGLFFGIIIIKISYETMQKKAKEKWYTAIFLLFYFTLINLLWCIALLKEVTRSENKW